jgi:hypothetical protein
MLLWWFGVAKDYRLTIGKRQDEKSDDWKLKLEEHIHLHGLKR